MCLETECVQGAVLSVDTAKRHIRVTSGTETVVSPLRTWLDPETNSPVVDVFSLFDAFEVLAVEPYMSVIVFVDHSLGEESGDEDGADGFQAVVGRACGDRVAVVSAFLFISS